MKLGFRLMTGAALSLGLLAGDISQASPLASAASAQDYYRGGHDYHGRSNGHVDAGALLLGAAVIGGIAAIASAAHRDNNRYYNDGYNGGYGGTYVQPGAAYSQYGQSQYGQSQYAQSQYGQSQYGYGQDGRQDVIAQCSIAVERAAQARGLDARVTRIFDVDGINGGGRVAGAIQFRVDNGYGDDGDDRVQQQRFQCTAQYGRITSLRFG
jgi:hypothetical protein